MVRYSDPAIQLLYFGQGLWFMIEAANAPLVAFLDHSSGMVSKQKSRDGR